MTLQEVYILLCTFGLAYALVYDYFRTREYQRILKKHKIKDTAKNKTFYLIKELTKRKT